MSNAIGSGLDVSDIVTQLMKIEHKQLDRLNKNKAIYDAQLNSYSGLKGLINQFNTALGSLNSKFNTNSYSVASSSEAVVSAASTGTGILNNGVYQLNVTQVAQSQKVASTAYTSKDTALGLSGTFVVNINSESYGITVNSGDSLETIRDNLNAINDKGFIASILSTTAVDGSAEYHLMLSSNDTGLANTMTFSGSVADSLSLTQEITAAKNAKFTFDGFPVERASNTISDLLDGLVFNLNGTTGAATLQVTTNTNIKIDTIKSGVQAVVDAFNAVVSEIDYNQSTSTLRDSSYSLVKSQMKNAMNKVMQTGTVQSILDLGIKSADSQTLSNKDGVQYVSIGKLQLDTAKLATQLRDNFHNVKQFFTAADTGLIASAQATVNGFTEPTGTISNREGIIHNQDRLVDARVEHEEDRLETVKASLVKQYSALDSYIQRYQHISDMLTNQLAALDSFHKK